MGNSHGLKSLALILLSVSSLSFSSPFVTVFEGAITEHFILGGMSTQQAQEDASKLTDSVFNRNVQENLEKHGMTSDSTIADYIFNKGNSEKISFKEATRKDGVFSEGVINSMNNKHLKGGEGVLFHIENKGTWEDRKTIQRMFREKGFNLVFKTSLPYRDLEKMAEYPKGYAIAPKWYGSTGMYIYRTELPIDREGNYFYADDPFTFYDWGLGAHINDLTLKETQIDLGEVDGKMVRFSVYKDEPYTYDDEKDAGIEFLNSYGNRYTLNYLYGRRVWDLSDEDLDFLIGEARIDGGCEENHYCVLSNLEIRAESASFQEEGEGTLLVLKNRDDISKEDQTIKEDDDIQADDFVTVYEDLSTPSTLENEIKKLADNYEITPESLTEIYNKELDEYKKNGAKDSKNELSKKAKSLLTSDKKLSHSSVSAGAKRVGLSKSGGGGVSATDLTKPISTINNFFSDSSDRKAVYYSDTKDQGRTEEKDKPIGTTGGNVADGESSNNTGSERGTGTSGKADPNTNTGTTAGAGSNTQSQTGNNSATNSIIRYQEKADTKESEQLIKSDDFELIPSAIDILKPLKDWRDGLVSKLQIAPISGNCPIIQFDFLDGATVEIDSHCLVFEKVAGLISAFMMAVWTIAAFRVLFTA